MGSIGAQLATDFVIHLEDNTSGLRVSEKRRVGSTGNNDTQIHYYEYEVYCDRSVLIGNILQTALMKDMDPSGPEICRPGGLCSFLTLNIHPGLALEYRGTSHAINEVQDLPIGRLVAGRNSRMRLIGTMDVFVCWPCCCLIPKLLNANMMPWNQYDIYDPLHDFSGAPKAAEPMERGGGTSGNVMVDAIVASKNLEQEKHSWSKSNAVTKPTCSPSSGVSKSFCTSVATSATNQSALTTPNSNTTPAKSVRDVDLKALEQLKDSGLLNPAEYKSKVNQVNAKYYCDMEEARELEFTSKIKETNAK